MLGRPDAILRVLDVVTSSGRVPVERLLIEGIACIAQQAHYAGEGSRALRAFDSHEWLLDFHESLAYLRKMYRVERVNGLYTLAPDGTDRLRTLNAAPGQDLEHEAQQIQGIARSARAGLAASLVG